MPEDNAPVDHVDEVKSKNDTEDEEDPEEDPEEYEEMEDASMRHDSSKEVGCTGSVCTCQMYVIFHGHLPAISTHNFLYLFAP